MARPVLVIPARGAGLLAFFALVVFGCQEGPSQSGAPPALPATEEPAAPCLGEACTSATAEAVAPACEATVPIYRAGRLEAAICPEDAVRQGLTLVDLSDAWVPRVLRGGGEAGPVGYAARYARIAAENLGADETWDRENTDRFFELYGIFPTLTVLAGRLSDEERHRCHASVDGSMLETLDEGLDTWQSLDEQRSDRARVATLERQLEEAREAMGLSELRELESDAKLGRLLALRDRLALRGPAIEAMQAHLRCERLLTPEAGRAGLMDSDTISAMFAYHRRHMLVAWQLDKATRDVLLSDSRELDFRTALRVLRERVGDATGLIEDGTASGRGELVVDRAIDTPTFDAATPGEGAPDLLSVATDAAARALGWLSPEATRSFLEAGAPSLVALSLPPLPLYHGPQMELRAEIDRGDVWYDFPYVPSGDRIIQSRERLPTTTLYVIYEGRRIDLVRWPTTIGSWQPETLAPGHTRIVYKESPPGPVIWRDVVAAPRWVPPASTPVRDLVRPRIGGGWAARHDTFGPHYASAYGLAMLIHHRIDTPPDGDPFLTDQGIRSHGSVSYDSILDGFSHGCHRLHNHRAVRLAGFLLAHRQHVVRGDIPLDFHRQFVWRSRRFSLDFATRGFRYELTPPVEVDVLEGRVRGQMRRPLGPQRLTRPMLKRYR